MFIYFIQKIANITIVLKLPEFLQLISRKSLREMFRAYVQGLVLETTNPSSSTGQEKENRRITGMTWLQAGCSVTVTLPKYLAAKYGLDEPCTVIFEDQPEKGGILIRKLILPHHHPR